MVIETSGIGNEAPIVLTLPKRTDTEARVLSSEEYRLLTATDQTPTPLRQTQAIECRRVGMYLKVPVRLDIHGVTIATTMILDTGASMTVLPKSLYNQGLAKPLDSLRTVQTQTANGTMTCPVDRIGVSTTAFAKTMVVALTNGSIPLLGTDYFSGYRFTVDLDRQCILINPTEESVER